MIGELELVLVGEHGTVQLVLVGVRDVVAGLQGVVAGPFAAGWPDTGTGRPDVGARASQVPSRLGEVGETGFQGLGLGAEEDDVSRGTVHVGQPRAVLLPDVADGPERLRRVEPPRGHVDPVGVKLRHLGKFLRDVRVAADDTSSVPHHTDQATVFPVTDLVLVRTLELPESVPGHGVLRRALLDLADEARPGSLLELVEQRRLELLLSHGISFPRWLSPILRVLDHRQPGGRGRLRQSMPGADEPMHSRRLRPARASHRPSRAATSSLLPLSSSVPPSRQARSATAVPADGMVEYLHK